MAYNAGEPKSSNFKTLLIFLVIHSVSKYLRIDSSLHYSRLYSNSSSSLWPVGGERVKFFSAVTWISQKKLEKDVYLEQGKFSLTKFATACCYELCHTFCITQFIKTCCGLIRVCSLRPVYESMQSS